MKTSKSQLVFTVKDRCRVCYTCLRECPVKAIRIINGQAEVISERCIGCGNCIKVCSQGAKVYNDNISSINRLFELNENVFACLAPSFPAEFTDISDYRVLIGMLKALGFKKVFEVAFGADLVAKKYRELIGQCGNKTCISSDCPAIVAYIEKYYPSLVGKLAPIVSPMVALARILRKKHGDNIKIVFIGPCIAKKTESDEIDEVLTFRELRTMFDGRKINSGNVTPEEFDPPHAGKGSIFPVSRGLLQTVNIKDDISDGNILVASGSVNFKEAIREMGEKQLTSQHLELLCCEGCIMGAGMTVSGEKFAKMLSISSYVKDKLATIDKESWEKAVEEYDSIDYSQVFEPREITKSKYSREQIQRVLQEMGKRELKDHLNCGACGYETCESHAIAISEGLAETEMCLPYTIEELHHSINELNITNENLANTRQALKHSEKLANMGQLSAGIAHELNNPLGVITMYSSIVLEESGDNFPFRKDLELIVEQTQRCKKIVGGLLNFARKNQVRPEKTDIGQFARHSLESVIKPDNIQVNFHSTLEDPMVEIDKDQMMQVLNNLEKNAIEAMPNGGELSVELNGGPKEVEIHVKDNGIGIAKENMDKIFTPFFTTKQPGKGTGLGLPLIYGIVKMHRGQISVTSNANPAKGKTGTNFKIVLPRKIG